MALNDFGESSGSQILHRVGVVLIVAGLVDRLGKCELNEI